MDAEPSADDGRAGELAALRRRVYGPEADIAADSVAWERLAKLERELGERGRPSAAGGPAPSEASDGGERPARGAAVTAASEPGSPAGGRMRRARPWIFAAVAGAVALVAIGALVVGELTQPRPVARLAPLALENLSPNLDEETLNDWELTDPEFLYHGSYGAAAAWSTSGAHEMQCMGVAVRGEMWQFHCTPPTMDTIVDIVINSDLVPRDDEGERIPEWSTIRFVLNDGVIDVYVGRNTEGDGS